MSEPPSEQRQAWNECRTRLVEYLDPSQPANLTGAPGGNYDTSLASSLWTSAYRKASGDRQWQTIRIKNTTPLANLTHR